MGKTNSVWLVLLQGVVLGGLLGLLDGLVAPILLELMWLISDLLRGQVWHGLMAKVIPASVLWLVLALLRGTIALIPSVIGGSTLTLVVYRQGHRRSFPKSFGLWFGMLVGMLVNWIGWVCFYVITAWPSLITWPPDWVLIEEIAILILLATIWGAIIYGLAGWGLSWFYSKNG